MHMLNVYKKTFKFFEALFLCKCRSGFCEDRGGIHLKFARCSVSFAHLDARRGASFLRVPVAFVPIGKICK